MNLTKRQIEYLITLLNNDKPNIKTNSIKCLNENLTKQLNNDLRIIDKDYIKKFKDIIKANKISLTKISKITDLSNQTISRIINNNYTNLSRTTKKKIKLFILEYERKHYIYI